MCGRYYRRSDKQRIAEAFHLGRLPEDFVLPPDYNVAPSTFQPVIRAEKETGERELVLMHWGMVPYFAKSAAEFKGFSTINAKAETVATNAMWRRPFERRRCLVPMDGFYEWKRVDAKTKQPFAFGMRDGEPFALAGLWDAWKGPDGAWLQSYAVITTDANELMEPVHNRMPVILKPGEYDRWLARDDEGQPPTSLLPLLRPFDAEKMERHAVDPRVGNVRVNEPRLCETWSCPPNSA
ncbi:MAG TPA: SOS response-associated peptidase [Acidobacteriaceae bacterium]|nr:SOS response-associated peptidase [Acidobacteriaceae bacterium]